MAHRLLAHNYRLPKTLYGIPVTGEHRLLHAIPVNTGILSDIPTYDVCGLKCSKVFIHGTFI